MKIQKLVIAVLIGFALTSCTQGTSPGVPADLKGSVTAPQAFAEHLNPKTTVEILETSGSWVKVKVGNNLYFGLEMIGWVNTNSPDVIWPVSKK